MDEYTLEYKKIEHYTMKCQLYPNKSQTEKIDAILNGLRIAHNVTMYEMKQHNPKVTKFNKEAYWPDFDGMCGKEWRRWLVENYPAVREVPAAAITTNNGIFKKDVKRAWKADGRHPVDKWEIKYYSKKKPRNSFLVQQQANTFKTDENPHVMWLQLALVGNVKLRGFNNQLRFSEDGEATFKDYCMENPRKQLTVQVTRDKVGEYWLCVSFPVVYKPCKVLVKREPIGVDVGVKDIAILSNGKKYANGKYKNGMNGEVELHRRRLERKLARRWGWANIKFREARKKDRTLMPSKTYLRTQKKIAVLERSIARKRDWANNNISTGIVRQATMVAVETLSVKNMFRNRHLANALSDAAMGTVLQQIKYKADWYGIECRAIERWTPSSKRCHICGYRKRDLKLSEREWTCPVCRTHHDRDINAAKNILMYAV